MRHRLSALRAPPPPSPPTALSPALPVIPVLLPAAADSGPVDWPAHSTPHSSPAALPIAAPLPRALAPPAARTTPSDSTQPHTQLVFRSPAAAPALLLLHSAAAHHLILGSSFVPLPQHLRFFCFTQQPHITHTLLDLLYEPAQYLLVMAHQPLHALPLVQVAVVLQRPDQPAPTLRHPECQVVFRRSTLQLQRSHLHAGPFDLSLRCVLQHQHHLKQRRVTQITLRL